MNGNLEPDFPNEDFYSQDFISRERFIAHIRNINGIEEQSLQEHCHGTAVLSGRYASSIGAENIGVLQGKLHDAGKIPQSFQDYVRNISNAKRGDIDHSYAGAKYICSFAESADAAKYHDVSRLIAHTIVSHHGLHDWIDGNNKDYCAARTQKTEGYNEIQAHLGEIVSNDEILFLLEHAAEEYNLIEAKIRKLCTRSKIAYTFYLGMLERFLQSCLIDADRTNTADFMSCASTENQYDTASLWEAMSKRMNEKCAEFSKRTDAISKQRCSISERCAEFAKNKVGACRLIVPTGGGKTLSSLRFAIEYCREHGKQKIIYTAPFMSILEQNSDEIRKIAGDEYFTEHHSNLLAEIDGKEELHEYELRTEKWDSPVIATTMIQLLNSLFLGKSSAVRRMHRLSNAVIIIDEIQSLPLKCVYMFNLAVNFLTHICGSTVILCSATQPTLEDVKYPILFDNETISMTGDIAKDFEVFRRTEVISKVTPYGHSYDEAAEFCMQKFEENGNLLMIVNTKLAAKTMFERLRECCKGTKIIHLSTNLCPVHRREKIEEMRRCLAENIPVICVTTQLIEAGVDISFKCVVRSLAGLDNAAQAAGRCNRNGEYPDLCPVYVIRLKEENLGSLEVIEQAQLITSGILDKKKYTDYLSYEAQREYFRTLYQQNENPNQSKKTFHYPIDKDDTILDFLSVNQGRFNMSGISKKASPLLWQAFKTAGTFFQVIDNNTKDIIVPYNDEAREIIEELDNNLTPVQCHELLRKAQKFSVSIYELQNRKLSENNALRQLRSGAIALERRFYDQDCGVIMEGIEMELLLF
ncbi:MAG: CRISPR-associated helicase Cas3' [Synergistaceae bacterium]|nr:CRISPR-associated helicase Cas3' [Synergistaceae bacterium]